MIDIIDSFGLYVGLTEEGEYINGQDHGLLLKTTTETEPNDNGNNGLIQFIYLKPDHMQTLYLELHKYYTTTAQLKNKGAL